MPRPPADAGGFREAWQGQTASLGWSLIELIEHDLDLTLTREQALRLVDYYAIDPTTGARLIRRAALRRPKGAGKSPEAGYVAYAELVGPVTFAGWDDLGQPVGVAHPDPWIQLAAVSEGQTDNVLVWLFDRLAARPNVTRRRGIDLGRTRIYLTGRPGRIEPVTSAAGSREGQRITFAALDQTEAWHRSNGGRSLADTLRRNAAKTGGWTLELQNAPAPGDGSVADLTGRAAERGAPGVLYDSREPGIDVPDLLDRPVLLQALRSVYGDAALEQHPDGTTTGWVDLDRLADEIADPDVDPADARRYYLNSPTPPTERAFDRTRWAGLAEAPPPTMAPGDLIVAGFDGARFDDSTALVACHVDTGYLWLVDLWERPANMRTGDEWEVDEAAVTDTVDDLLNTWDVWRLYADPPYWTATIAAWHRKHGRVHEWWTNRPRPVGHAVRAFADAIRAGELHHDGNPDLGRHITNAVRRPLNSYDDQRRRLWTIAKPAPALKIDAAMAAVIAWEARSDAIRTGARRRSSGSYAAW